MILSTQAEKQFDVEVRRRARATLGLRGKEDFACCCLCTTALDQALTRGGEFTEDLIVATARTVADHTQRFRQ